MICLPKQPPLHSSKRLQARALVARPARTASDVLSRRKSPRMPAVPAAAMQRRPRRRKAMKVTMTTTRRAPHQKAPHLMTGKMRSVCLKLAARVPIIRMPIVPPAVLPTVARASPSSPSRNTPRWATKVHSAIVVALSTKVQVEPPTASPRPHPRRNRSAASFSKTDCVKASPACKAIALKSLVATLRMSRRSDRSVFATWRLSASRFPRIAV